MARCLHRERERADGRGCTPRPRGRAALARPRASVAVTRASRHAGPRAAAGRARSTSGVGRRRRRGRRVARGDRGPRGEGPHRCTLAAGHGRAPRAQDGARYGGCESSSGATSRRCRRVVRCTSSRWTPDGAAARAAHPCGDASRTPTRRTRCRCPARSDTSRGAPSSGGCRVPEPWAAARSPHE